MITLDIDQSFADDSDRLTTKVTRTIEDAITQNFKDTYQGRISVSYVSDAEIRRLNRMYRGKDAVTDVLSFSYLDQPVGKGDQIGDVVISIEQAKRQAEAGDIELELADLVIHGILHVLGYDHEVPEDAARMFPLQDKLVQQIV